MKDGSYQDHQKPGSDFPDETSSALKMSRRKKESDFMVIIIQAANYLNEML
jgi:hypothetical protein